MSRIVFSFLFFDIFKNDLNLSSSKWLILRKHCKGKKKRRQPMTNFKQLSFNAFSVIIVCSLLCTAWENSAVTCTTNDNLLEQKHNFIFSSYSPIEFLFILLLYTKLLLSFQISSLKHFNLFRRILFLSSFPFTLEISSLATERDAYRMHKPLFILFSKYFLSWSKCSVTEIF